MQVMTIKGPLEYESLRVQDVVTLVPNGRKVATEYFLGDELVKRTVTVDILMPLTTAAVEGNLGG
jgi:hypothetical protein